MKETIIGVSIGLVIFGALVGLGICLRGGFDYFVDDHDFIKAHCAKGSHAAFVKVYGCQRNGQQLDCEVVACISD